MEKKIDRILHYELPEFAYFEDRRYERNPCDEFIFISKSHLFQKFPQLSHNLINNTQNEKALSLNDYENNKYISLNDLVTLLSVDEYNFILLELTENAKDYDQVNMVFTYLRKYHNYNLNTINEILVTCLQRRVVQISFEARRHILTLVKENLDLIEPRIIRRILDDFPHQIELLFENKRIKHDELVNSIEKYLEEKESISGENIEESIKNRNETCESEFEENVKIPDLKMHEEIDWLSVGDDEIRRMDKETEGDWRIGNDFG